MWSCVITSRIEFLWTALTVSSSVNRGMRLGVYAIALALTVSTGYSQRFPQESASPPAPPPIADKTPAPELPLSTNSTVLRTNSMSVLDDKKHLGPNDYVSFRVVEDRDNDSQRLRVNDNG